MIKPIFKKWEFITNLSTDILYFKGLYDDHEGFRVLLETESDNKLLKVSFDTVLSYRNTDESDLIKLFDESEGIGGGCVYTVSKSNFLKSFHDNNHGIRQDEVITHFAIYTPSACLDILSISNPDIMWV